MSLIEVILIISSLTHCLYLYNVISIREVSVIFTIIAPYVHQAITKYSSMISHKNE